MDKSGSTLAGLALVSAVLANFVVPLETVTPASAAVAPRPPIFTLPHVPYADYAAIEVTKLPAPAGADRSEPKTSPTTRTTRIPVGCERVVSGLVRSTAALQISRCVT